MKYMYEKNKSVVELLGNKCVFMHEINTLPGFESVISQVDGIDKYERALPIARRDDVVFLKKQPEESYLEWLEDVDLGTRNIIVLNDENNKTLPEMVMKNEIKKEVDEILGDTKCDTVLTSYYGGWKEKKASEYLQLFLYAEPDIVRRYDSKINFKHLCRKLNIPVADDVIFDVFHGPEEMLHLVKSKLHHTGKVIVRGEYGASASTIYVLSSPDREKIKEIINNSLQSDRYLIEPFYNVYSSPSSVWFIGKDKGITLLRNSNQLLCEGISHNGNEFPLPEAEEPVERLTYKIARHLADEGFIGPFGVDYIVTQEALFASEINPRMTGAIYPWELVNILEKKGQVNAARASNITLPKKGLGFKELRNVWNGLLYDGRKSSGVIIPFNVGPVAEGKVSVLATGEDKKEVDSLFAEMKLRLKELV